MIRDQELFIVNPSSRDNLTIYCQGAGNSRSIPLEIGLYKTSLEPRCTYHTTEIAIPITLRSKLEEPEKEFPELSLINLLLETEQILDKGNLFNLSSPAMQDMLRQYSSDVEAQGKTVSKLVEEIKRVDSIRQLTDYNPTKFELQGLSTAKIGRAHV